MEGIDVAQLLISLALGISLSASCGFRIFVPCFITSLASLAGWIQLGEGFAWLGTWPALICLGVATLTEIAAYYIPAVDNFLDTVAVPASAIAGTILTASLLTVDISPMLKWGLALVAGGGTAATVNAATASVRAASTTSTMGLGNSGVATAELGASAGLGILALILPVFAVLLAIVLLIVSVALIRKCAKALKARKQRRAAKA